MNPRHDRAARIHGADGGSRADGGSQADGGSPTAPAEPPYASVVESYLIQLLGPERGGRASRGALDDLAGLAKGSAPPDVADVRRVAERAGLEGIDAEARRLSRPLGVGGRPACWRIGRRLQARAEGQISAKELNAFYLHLERCQRCGAVASRFDAAQWSLQLELGAAQRSNGVGPRRLAAVPQTGPPPPAAPASGQAKPEARPPAGPASASGQAKPEAPPPAGPASRQAKPAAWRPRRGLQVLVLAAVAVAIAAGLVLWRSPAPKPPRTASPASPVGRLTSTIRARADGTPFVVDGARFAAFVNPGDRWTAFARTVPAASGDRWLLIAVRTRNLSRPTFDPRLLAYRLVATGGLEFLPNAGRGTGANVPRSARPRGPGTLTQAELAFEVPSTASGLRLVFHPSGPNGARVVVVLGN